MIFFNYQQVGLKVLSNNFSKINTFNSLSTDIENTTSDSTTQTVLLHLPISRTPDTQVILRIH